MKHIDLHTHTFYSDGSDDPESLVRGAKLKGTDVLAITDHDTMSGYFAAIKEAKRWGIELVAGVEVTTRDYHILGLNVDPSYQPFQDFLKRVQELQKKVCEQRTEILEGHAVPINLEKIEQAFPHSRLGKYNILMTMMVDEECRVYNERAHPGKNADELFEVYLRKKGIAGNVPKKYFVESKEAIKQIHKAGGVAIIAHPFKDIKDLRSEMDTLVEEGIDGVEVQPNYACRNFPYIAYAQEKGLPLTYGSDYHGPAVGRTLLGKMVDSVNCIEERALEKLLNRWR